MSFISKKTLSDLEFDTVLQHIETFAVSDLGKNAVLKIKPYKKENEILEQLKQTSEYHASFENENRIPNHYFDDLENEIHLLSIENSYLETKSFLKIATNASTVKELLRFFNKFKAIYPALFKASETIEWNAIFTDTIAKYITKFGEVDDNASKILKDIRKDINLVKGNISGSFSRVLSKQLSNGYLDDIKESVIDNQRVLAVLAMHRKKVKGSLLGTSKTGSIAFIVPQETLQLERQLQNLLFEEKQEIIKLLKELTNIIRPYDYLLKTYQQYLTQIDVVGAKSKYAVKIKACLPKITHDKKLYYKDAFHPILVENNQKQGVKTIPQTILLDQKQRIIVISGPNAGGKSITLKTIGLLQVMLQSGMLIPVHERSETCFFNTILTDIGDNQSIENQLSTYSYRLKNMRNFLQKCNANTLFLIDEFGTGSDPELGGALAETLLEEFYEKNAFGIITTHYANLKLLANELPNITNANMQFNERTLQPLYKLFVGEAGSSFTFEVAQKIGIPYRLINKSKKKIEGQKLRFDKTINKLQKERVKLQKTAAQLTKEKDKAIAKTDTLSAKELKIQEKLESFQNLYENNQKMLTYGRKFNEILQKLFQTNNKKEFNAAIKKLVLIEQSKLPKKLAAQKSKNAAKKLRKETKNKKLAEKKKLEATEKIVQKAVQAEKKKQQIIAAAKPKIKVVFHVKDTVRLIDGTAKGTIEKIEKNMAFINYGMFTTKASLDKLELVKKGS